MDVLVFCLVVLGLSAFVAAPLYVPLHARSNPEPDIEGPGDGPAAQPRLQTLMRALRELEIDRASGLVTGQTHAAEQAALEAEAATFYPEPPAPTD